MSFSFLLFPVLGVTRTFAALLMSFCHFLFRQKRIGWRTILKIPLFPQVCFEFDVVEKFWCHETALVENRNTDDFRLSWFHVDVPALLWIVLISDSLKLYETLYQVVTQHVKFSTVKGKTKANTLQNIVSKLNAKNFGHNYGTVPENYA